MLEDSTVDALYCFDIFSSLSSLKEVEKRKRRAGRARGYLSDITGAVEDAPIRVGAPVYTKHRPSGASERPKVQ